MGKNSTAVSKPNPTTLSNETGLNEEALVSLLRNSYELQQQQQVGANAEARGDNLTVPAKRNEEEEEEERKTHEKKVTTSNDNQEVRECPMCYWEFPNHLTLDSKKQHIEAHFD